MADDEDTDWERMWNARTTALAGVFGPMDDTVGHATIPFEVGAELGGAADVVYFRQFVAGSVLSVTSELIGRDDQAAGELGNYELAICQRGDDPWGTNLVCRLAHYTLEAALNPGETMDLDDAVPTGSSISALLFLELARFEVLGRSAGVLLCMGITHDELSACRDGRRPAVEHALRRRGVYPHTDHTRASVVRAKRWWPF